MKDWVSIFAFVLTEMDQYFSNSVIKVLALINGATLDKLKDFKRNCTKQILDCHSSIFNQ